MAPAGYWRSPSVHRSLRRRQGRIHRRVPPKEIRQEGHGAPMRLLRNAEPLQAVQGSSPSLWGLWTETCAMLTQSFFCSLAGTTACPPSSSMTYRAIATRGMLLSSISSAGNPPTAPTQTPRRSPGWASRSYSSVYCTKEAPAHGTRSTALKATSERSKN